MRCCSDKNTESREHLIDRFKMNYMLQKINQPAESQVLPAIIYIWFPAWSGSHTVTHTQDNCGTRWSDSERWRSKKPPKWNSNFSCPSICFRPVWLYAADITNSSELLTASENCVLNSCGAKCGGVTRPGLRWLRSKGCRVQANRKHRLFNSQLTVNRWGDWFSCQQTALCKHLNPPDFSH